MKILFYSLNAAIWLHALPESRLVRELRKRGHETVYVSCGSMFPNHCTSMEAYGVGPGARNLEKEPICRLCAKHAKFLTDANGARHLRLVDYLRDDDRSQIASLLATVTRKNYLSLQAMGVDVGRAAAYELFLKYKKMSQDLSQEEWAYYRIYLENALLSLYGFARIFEGERPDAVFFYSPQYGVNGVCAGLAASRGVKTYFVEGSSSNAERYGALRIWDWQVHGLVNPGLTHWDTVKLAVSRDDVSRVSRHFHELFRAKSFAVYSAPIDGRVSVRARYAVPPGAKLLLLTLSSCDEAYAALIIGKFPERKVISPVFKDQFEWVRYMIRHVADRPDLFLIIRVHPRDFSNKRETERSEQSFLWEDIFRSLPANVAINWPQDGISLYDIFREVDLLTTGWSATGIEAQALGIPVVTYDSKLPSYPADIHFTGESVECYQRNIDRALAAGRRFDHAANALLWLAVNFSIGTVRVKVPIALEKWLRILLFRSLRNWAHATLNGTVKKLEARRSFGPAADADRFAALVAGKRSSLFEVASPPRQAAAVTHELAAVHRSVAKAVGARSVTFE